MWGCFFVIWMGNKSNKGGMNVLLNAVGMTIVGVAVFILIIVVAYKMFVKKQSIDSSNAYTPFDYITGQTSHEFHEEDELVQESEDEDEGNLQK